MSDETVEVHRSQLRLERLAILEDRANRNASDPADLADALRLAREAHEDAAQARHRAAEVSGWRQLVETNVQLLAQAEPHLEKLAGQKRIQTAFFNAAGSPKVIISLGGLVIIILAALAGALTIEPVTLPLPGPQPAVIGQRGSDE